jgi:hypothetical protein
MAEARAISRSASTREPRPGVWRSVKTSMKTGVLVLFFHHQPWNFKHLQEGFAENWVLLKSLMVMISPHSDDHNLVPGPPWDKAKIILMWCHSCIQLHLSIAWLVHVGSIFKFHFEGHYPKLLKTCIWLYPKISQVCHVAAIHSN